MWRLYIFTTILLIFFLIPIPLAPALAQSSAGSGKQLQIDEAQFLLDQGEIEEDKSLPSTSPGKKEQPSTQITAGFGLGSNQTKSFRLSLPNILIDFGELSPTNPIIRSTEILFFNSVSPLYTIYIWEDHPLQMSTGGVIPDTTCDTGTCTQFTSAAWGNTLTYGFGYRCELINQNESGCDYDFKEPFRFKQFPSLTDKDLPIELWIGSASKTSKRIAMVTKVNIAQNQPAGTYTNTLNLVAVPGY